MEEDGTPYVSPSQASTGRPVPRPSLNGMPGGAAHEEAWAANATPPPSAPPLPGPVTMQVCRCLVRYLKGHGMDYALDAGTWAHYRWGELGGIAGCPWSVRDEGLMLHQTKFNDLHCCMADLPYAGVSS